MKRTQFGGTLTLPVSPERDHVRGSLDAPVTLLEYGDYQCPFCAAAAQVVQEVLERMGGQILFAYRHFPLTTVHPYAQPAAEAAEAAGAQRKFWAMHEILFANQQQLHPAVLGQFAKAAGLDLARFSSDLSEHVHLPKVREDFMSGVTAGVNGTPAFYINGVRHDGSWDAVSLMAALQASM